MSGLLRGCMAVLVINASVAAVTLAGCGPHSTTVTGAKFRSVATLKQEFNAGHGRTRVVTLASPTCGMCLQGAVQVSQVTATLGDEVEAFVAWVPMLGGTAGHLGEASRVVADTSARHYWDADGELIDGYQKTLRIDEPAWDIYLIYGPDARWDEDPPPAPDYWMHQLGAQTTPRVTTAPVLDPDRFAVELRRIMD